MIPENNNKLTQAVNQPYTTYKMNMESLTIEGLCDGKEALRQAIYKLIMTERASYLIYNRFYGISLIDLYGKDMGYASAVIRLRLEDCFKNDDRIKGISDLTMTKDKNKMELNFTVSSIYGNMDFYMEV